jgi:hypothetical protein
MKFTIPSKDPFYKDVPPVGSPGTPLRVRTVAIETDVAATAHQVVHVSTGALGQPIVVSGTILVPSAPWHGSDPRPILSYGVGVHGLGRDAAPSHLMREGTESELPLISSALALGWAVVVTDGEGLGMPGPHTYGAGHPGGHAMLDIVRAATRCVPELQADAPVLVWGYSEGGRCAAWAAELHPSYAPELNLVAAAAGGVPSDLYAVARAIDAGPYSGLGLAVLVGLAHAHQRPELWDFLSEEGRCAAAHAATLDVVGLILEHPEPMGHHTKDDPWDEPGWRALLREELNGQRRPEVPVYLYHAVVDDIVPNSVGRRLRNDYVALGAQVTWSAVQAHDHLSAQISGASDALAWLWERVHGQFDGRAMLTSVGVS